MILLVILVILAALVLFAVWPGAKREDLRAPFYGRNYAHRGYFGKDQRPPENSLPAFAAAARHGYGIELDVQFTSDRRLVVFHDDTLDRMTPGKGFVHDAAWAEFSAMPLAGSDDHPPLFADMLRTVAEANPATPLIVEIKSRHEYTKPYLEDLCRATLAALKAYPGPYCIESFDPRVVGIIRHQAPGVLRGQLSDSYRSYRHDGTHPVPAYVLSHCFGNFLGRPDFIAWCPDKRNWAVRLADALGAMPVMWTALPEHNTKQLEAENDAVIFQCTSRWKNTNNIQNAAPAYHYVKTNGRGAAYVFIYGNKTRLAAGGGACPVRGMPVRHGGGSGAFLRRRGGCGCTGDGHGGDHPGHRHLLYGLRVRDGPVQRGGG